MPGSLRWIAMATQLTRNRRQSISINGRRWHWAGDSLRALDAEIPDTQDTQRTPPKP